MAHVRSLLTTTRLPAILVASLMLGSSAVAAGPPASSETVVWSFGRASREPASGLIADGAGNFYGEVQSGLGVIFELSPPATTGGAWTETIVHRFFGGFYGCGPGGGLILDGAGNLYGTAGCGFAGGGGIVFRLARPTKPNGGWVETVLYAFKPTRSASGDGAYPHGRLAFDAHGNLYGTTVFGGKHGYGTVYELAPPAKQGDPWSETMLYNFKGVKHGIQHGIDGYYPDHGVILDATGALYGTTTSGGSTSGPCGGDCGTVFKLTPPAGGKGWRYSVIHFFAADGYDPQCELIFDGAGNLYGTTEYGGASTGGGTVFKLSPPSRGHTWQPTVLYSFPKFAGDSDYPASGVVVDSAGNVYGTSEYGGAIAAGTVFRLTQPSKGNGSWTESVLHTFAGGSDGSYPAGELLFGADGKLYGTTQYGGPGMCPGGKYRGCGTVFAISS